MSAGCRSNSLGLITRKWVHPYRGHRALAHRATRGTGQLSPRGFGPDDAYHRRRWGPRRRRYGCPWGEIHVAVDTAIRGAGGPWNTVVSSTVVLLVVLTQWGHLLRPIT